MDPANISKQNPQNRNTKNNILTIMSTNKNNNCETTDLKSCYICYLCDASLWPWDVERHLKYVHRVTTERGLHFLKTSLPTSPEVPSMLASSSDDSISKPQAIPNAPVVQDKNFNEIYDGRQSHGSESEEPKNFNGPSSYMLGDSTEVKINHKKIGVDPLFVDISDFRNVQNLSKEKKFAEGLPAPPQELSPAASPHHPPHEPSPTSKQPTPNSSTQGDGS